MVEHSRIFGFDKSKVMVSSPKGGDVDFCEKYFAGYAEICPVGSQSPDWTVKRTDETNCGPESWFVDQSRRKINVCTESDDSLFLMRIVRSLVILEDIAKGKTVFKGSCFITKSGEGVVLMGQRRSGKTSLLLSYLLKEGDKSRFVTNSVVSLETENNNLSAFGYPMAIGVRGTVVASLINRGNFELEKLATLEQEDQRSDKRFYVDPPTLRELLQGRIVSSAHAGAIVILKNVPGEKRSKIRRLSHAEAGKYLREYHSKYHNKENGSWFNLYRVGVDEGQQGIDDFLSKCNFFELTYNMNGHEQTVKLIDQI